MTVTEFTPARLTSLLARHGIRPSRRLGQHFLVDANLIGKIVRTARISPGDRVLEVGAGVGNLTAALAAAGTRVTAYEIDDRLTPVLTETVTPWGERVEIRMEDAMTVDWTKALPGPGWVMVSNLPYGVGTPLLLEMLQKTPKVRRFVVMLQREVVQRLTARPGSQPYGLPSVIVGLYSSVGRVFHVPPQVFHPRPEVYSSVVELQRIVPHPDAGLAVSLAARAFRERRKMLRRSLRRRLPDPESTLWKAGISPEQRPETLSPDDFLRLAEVVRRREASP